MTISFTPKSTFCNKIPPFDKQNFSTCKSKAMKALEFVDFDMLDVISKFPIVVMPKSSNDGASGSKLKGKYVLGYTKKEKRMLNLNENSSDDEGNCLMAKFVESHANVSHDNIGTLAADLCHADKDFKPEWDDTSTYQYSISTSEPEDQSKSSTSDHYSMRYDPHNKVVYEHTIDDTS
ncbi:unnamed protein product [Lactuca saligna]|uniref:Uncharacterized protein n=1 Tax=Lactuca saligna TaxID=75948 RepID=A0AA36EGW3_LACSI|nr:unnamed protein product [Lactuca saligna]